MFCDNEALMILTKYVYNSSCSYQSVKSVDTVLLQIFLNDGIAR